MTPSTSSARLEAPLPQGRQAPIHVAIGLVLASALLTLHVLGVEWIELERLQAQRSYQMISGAILAATLLAGWQLPIVRLFRSPGEVRVALATHRFVGALSPVVFWLHSTRFGFGHLLVLSLAFHANFALALILNDGLRLRGRRWAYTFLALHVPLSMLITVLSTAHALIAIYFE